MTVEVTTVINDKADHQSAGTIEAGTTIITTIETETIIEETMEGTIGATKEVETRTTTTTVTVTLTSKEPSEYRMQVEAVSG